LPDVCPLCVDPGDTIAAPHHVGAWNDLTVAEQFGVLARMGEALATGAPGFLASDEHGHFHLRAPSHSDQSNLTTGGGDPLFPLLFRCIDGAERVDLAVAFAMDSGVRLIEPWLRDLLARGGQLRLVVGDYMDVTEPAALWRLSDLEGATLRVYPGTYSFLAKPSEHGTNCGPSQERQRVSVQAFPVLGQAATVIEPANGPFDHPPFGQDDEFGDIRPLDDLDIDLAANLLQFLPELRSLVAAVGVEFQQGRVPAEQRAHQQDAAVAVLNTGRMDNGLHQETLGIDEDVTLLALDLLAGVKARRVDGDPPFSALLTL